ncbi:MAG TPA: hypothetical protein VMU54_20675 [Planctomycetota bacterium]|nr:hypothetical protein [Planctomycetota bacterium]
MTEKGPPDQAARVRPRLEALIPAAILVLRVALRRTPWFFDWMIVLSLYWILYVFLAGRRERTFVTVGVMLLLLGIYLWRVLPILADTFLFCL